MEYVTPSPKVAAFKEFFEIVKECENIPVGMSAVFNKN